MTIDGAALGGATQVTLRHARRSFTVLSPTQIEAIVPERREGRQDLGDDGTGGSRDAKAKFTPTLSLDPFSPSSGPPASWSRSKGVGFTSSSQVSFDGVPAASVTFDSSTKLTVAVPAGAGAGPITVTNTTAPLGTVSSAAGFSPS